MRIPMQDNEGDSSMGLAFTELTAALGSSSDIRHLIEVMLRSPGLNWAFRRLLDNDCLLDVVHTSSPQLPFARPYLTTLLRER
jgi:hypothetical protein